MMKQIPYNINMMDETGHIIASGDKTRLNSLHTGAKKAIATKEVCVVKKNTKHNLSGVNTPIFFDKQVVGVIGITGDPKQVTPLASLLKVATELLLNQAAANEQQQAGQLQLNQFLYHWIQIKDSIENHSDIMQESKQLAIDILIPRRAIVIQDLPTHVNILDVEDYKIVLSSGMTVILTKLETTLTRCLALSEHANLRMGIGNLTKNIGTSVNEARKAVQLGKLFNQPLSLFYNDIQFIDNLLNANLPVAELVTKFSSIDDIKSGEDIITTLSAYIAHNGDIAETAKSLFIHRNTLTYRLKIMQKRFNLDPKNTTDLFQLYIGLIYFIYHKNN